MARLTSRCLFVPRATLVVALALVAAGLIGCQPTDSPVAEASGGTASRIISLAPNLTELVFAAGAGDRLVGVVEYSDYPFEARSLQRVGDAFRVDFETIRVLDPDLILVWQSGNPAAIVSRLRELDYRVIELEPATLDSVATQIELIGSLAGTGETANKSARKFRDELAVLRQRYSDAPVVRVFYQIAAEPYFTIGGTHYINDALESCGGQNIFTDITDLAPSVTLEAVISENPEVIIASAKDDDWRAGWLRWRSVRAVASTNLYAIDPDLISRSGPRVVQGVRQICAALDEARKKL
jgi:iron complex transport system substrate-binding protein